MKTIVIEGPDGAGKSTLAQELVHLGYELVHFGVPPKDARRNEESIFHFFFAPLYEHTAVKRHPVVFDRLHLSDYVYGSIVRNEHVMTPRVQALVERYLEAVDGQVVLCLPPKRTALANWLQNKGKEYVKEARTISRVYDLYARLLFSRRNHGYVWFDYTRHRVKSFARALATIEGTPLPAGLVGSQRPRFLFVGERAHGEPDLPFMTTRNCSGWLFDVLVEAGYEEHEMAFANALDARGKPTDLSAAYFSFSRVPTLVALGDQARQRLSAVGLPHQDGLTHPQHAKRFQTKERAAYVARLAEIRRGVK